MKLGLDFKDPSTYAGLLTLISSYIEYINQTPFITHIVCGVAAVVGLGFVVTKFSKGSTTDEDIQAAQAVKKIINYALASEQASALRDKAVMAVSQNVPHAAPIINVTNPIDDAIKIPQQVVNNTNNIVSDAAQVVGDVAEVVPNVVEDVAQAVAQPAIDVKNLAGEIVGQLVGQFANVLQNNNSGNSVNNVLQKSRGIIGTLK